MTRTALFIVGSPGVGKTAVARALLGFPDVRLCATPKWTLGADSETCAAGHYTGATFDGADTIAYNGVAKWLGFWELNLAPYCDLTIFDGDRFSHDAALARVAASAWVVALHLTAPAEVLAARRAERGSNQNAAWIKGRETKAARFASTFVNKVEIDARESVATITAALCGVRA